MTAHSHSAPAARLAQLSSSHQLTGASLKTVFIVVISRVQISNDQAINNWSNEHCYLCSPGFLQLLVSAGWAGFMSEWPRRVSSVGSPA